jgi:hypothetical protein
MQLPVRPIISGFHPDPSICRVGEDHYLACSSFEYAPGVPIYHSKDLRSWQQIGHALDRSSQLAVAAAPSSGGVYAPTLRYHDGRFYLITTNTSDRSGQLLVTAENPAGSWSDPVWIPEALGIDPDLAWAEDGTCYLTWSALSASGHDGIVQAVLNPAAGTLGERRSLWQGTGGKFPEGPHLYRIGNYWYLVIAEGGTERGHAATIARGASPSGPFEPSPWNPLLTARSTDFPVQNTGHADLVERPDGRWAVVYLGIRPRGYTPQWHVLGRETFASEVVWRDDWPRLAEPIEPTVPAAFVEVLDASELPPSWIAPGRFPADVLRPLDGGWQLTATSAEPTFVGRRQEHLAMRAQASVRADHGAGGLELRIDPRHAVALEVGGGLVRAVLRVGAVRATLGELPAGPDVVLELRAEPSEQQSLAGVEAGPDELVAGIVQPDGFHELGRVDGRYLSTEVAGGFTGRVVGLFCSEGYLHVRSFRYAGADDASHLQSRESSVS